MNYESCKTSRYWFEKHTKSDFTRYAKILAKICWSYWIVVKYSHLADLGRTKEAEGFIEGYRDEVFKKMSSASNNINEWDNAPSDIRALLMAIYKSTETFLSGSIEISDRINFHNKYGVKIEEPLDDLLGKMEKEQYLMRMYAQHTDETDLNSMYYKWANAFYETIKHLGLVGDNNSWETFRRYCLENMRGTLPTQGQIESSAAATIAHLEIEDDVRSELAQKYTDLWLQLFMSSAQFNSSIQFLVSSREFPSDNDLKKYESLLEEATSKQSDSSITLANLLLSEEIYTSSSLNRL
jgi:hypothetical protein